VQNGAFLDVGSPAHHDRRDVAPQHGVVQVETSSSIVTSPTITAPGAMKAPDCTRGTLSSNR
jgi:hypothetical protein